MSSEKKAGSTPGHTSSEPLKDASLMRGISIILTDISIELSEKTGKVALTKQLKELRVYGHPKSEEGVQFPLCEAEGTKGRWEMRGFIELPPSVHTLRVVVKDEAGENACHLPVDYTHTTAGEHGIEFEKGRAVTQEVITSQGWPIKLHMTETFAQSGRLCCVLGVLGKLKIERFSRTGGAANIEDAILFERRAVQLTPAGDPRLVPRLASLGLALQSRFRYAGKDPDLNEAISHQLRALQLTPDGDPNHYLRLAHLASSLLFRFQRAGKLPDLAEAISLQQKALLLVQDGHPRLPEALGNLGALLMSRFQHTGEPSDLAEAIPLWQRGLSLTSDWHPSRAQNLANLGFALLTHFQQIGEDADLEHAISCQRRSLQLTPDGHPDFSQRLANLGSSLWSRFQRTGEVTYINEAVGVMQDALNRSPPGHPALAQRFANLGSILRLRFQHTGELSDLTEAVSLQRQAVRRTPEGHPDLAQSLTNLGLALQSRFLRTREVADLTEAVSLLRRVLRLTPDGHPEISRRLSNLGMLLHSRFQHTGSEPDLIEAISLQQRSLQLTPDGHPNLAQRLENLASSLWSRFQSGGQVSDLAEVLSLYQRALNITPNGHPNLGFLLVSMAGALSARHNIGRGTPQDISTAISYCKRAASSSTGATYTGRLLATQEWIRLLRMYSPNSLDIIPAFDCALSVIAQKAGLDQTIHGRYSQLQNSFDFTLEASSTAFVLRRLDKALEWLEQGRCLVWGQLHSLRSPLDELRSHDSDLADSIASISRRLDIAALSRAHAQHTDTLQEKMSSENAARRHQNLTREWDDAVAQARRVPGFERLFLPSTSCDLLRHLPPSGYVVVINVHVDRCDALVLSSVMPEMVHIPLPSFSFGKAEAQRNALKAEFGSHWFRTRHGQADYDDTEARGCRIRRGSKRPLAKVLRDLWLDLVKPVFDVLGIKKTDASSGESPPRIWWCPTGILSFLPVHAAGIYEAGKPAICALDYAISSYTPTVASLTNRVKDKRGIDERVSGLLLTSQPNPRNPPCTPIPGTTTEVRSIVSRACENGVKALKLEGDDVTVEDYLKQMENFSSVHIACHGSQNANDPLSSRFLFHNGSLELRQIIKKNLRHADLAFLSACQTSVGEEKLANEAVHLAAGMLAAGYRRVVATMWPIGDGDAPQVAQDFYEYLLDRRKGAESGFDGSLSAEALHYAIQCLRSRLDNSDSSLLAWAPYVHWGY